MMINGNLLVEVTPAEATLIRELLGDYADGIGDGSISGTPDDVRDVQQLRDRFDTP